MGFVRKSWLKYRKMLIILIACVARSNKAKEWRKKIEKKKRLLCNSWIENYADKNIKMELWYSRVSYLISVISGVLLVLLFNRNFMIFKVFYGFISISPSLVLFFVDRSLPGG
jgi:hypothetical protein